LDELNTTEQTVVRKLIYLKSDLQEKIENGKLKYKDVMTYKKIFEPSLEKGIWHYTTDEDL